MSKILKRVVAIIALVLILVFTVSFIMYLFDKTLFNGAIGDLATWSGAFGILLALVLWISHSYPAQEVKDEERERLYKEAEEAERLQHEKEQAESEEAAKLAEQEGREEKKTSKNDENP